MGYYTSVRGEITISPPIPWGDIRKSEFLRRVDGWTVGDRSVALRIAEETVDTDEGTLTRREAIAVEPVKDESYKTGGDRCWDDLRLLLVHHGEGHTFSGYLSGEGEDHSDLWRLYVVDGIAKLVTARIEWDEP